MAIINFLRAVFPFFWGNDKKIHKLIILAICFGLFSVALNLSIPITLRYILNFLSTHVDKKPEISVLLIVVSYGLVWTLAQVSLTLRSVFLFKPMHRTSGNLIETLFKHVLSLPLSFHLDRKTGSLISVIEQAQQSMSTLINVILWQLAPLLLEVSMAIAITCWMYGAVYGAMIFFTLFFYAISTFLTVNQSIKYQAISLEKKKNVSSYVHDSLLNYETIKYFNNDDFEIARCHDVMREKESAATKIDVRMYLISICQMLIVGTGIICITSYAGYSILNRHLTIGDFVLLNGYVLQFSVPMSYFGYVIREFKQAVLSIKNTLTILNMKSDVCDIENATIKLDATDIHFNDVHFSYNDEREILHGISFQVPQGKTLAIVGPTGSGKSTIAKCLFRFFDISSGEISIHGQDIKTMTIDSLRQAIGIVPQDAHLFNNTLRYNIAYGNMAASEAGIMQAVKLAGLDSFIKKLPAGLETVVGERGLKISGGEKQRVAIARMLLKNPKIYIFDEATSSLDVEMEQQIQKNIEAISKNITTIIIAHRLSTVKHADEIIVLHHGKILERGTHHTLLMQRGYYYDMFQRQAHVGVVSELII